MRSRIFAAAAIFSLSMLTAIGSEDVQSSKPLNALWRFDTHG